jgi:LysR family transcriptional regulator, transcriptional activator of nhaA
MTNLHLNYNHLLYFKTIVEQESISLAAKYLRVGPPAVSMQLKLLEDRLQKKLFIRKKRQLMLTDTGRIVYEYAKEIFALGEELLVTLNDQAYGDIKIQLGVQDSVPKNLISILTSYIYENFTAMISVFNGSLEEMTLGVASHQFDLAILNNPPLIQDKSLFMSKKVLKARLVLAGSKKFLHLKGKPFSSFSGVPFILPTNQSVLRHKLEYYFNANDIKYHLAAEVQDTMVQKNMAISGNGIIPIVEEAIAPYLESGDLFILKRLPDIYEEIWLVSGRRRIENPIANSVMKKFHF